MLDEETCVQWFNMAPLLPIYSPPLSLRWSSGLLSFVLHQLCTMLLNICVTTNVFSLDSTLIIRIQWPLFSLLYSVAHILLYHYLVAPSFISLLRVSCQSGHIILGDSSLADANTCVKA